MALAIGILVLRLALQLTIVWAGPEDTFRRFVRYASFGDGTSSGLVIAGNLRNAGRGAKAVPSSRSSSAGAATNALQAMPFSEGPNDLGRLNPLALTARP